MLTDKRISSIDILRGMVMVLMTLDHTRDFFHIEASQFLAEDLTKSTPAIFLTRWITHFCAPAFAFLAGVSAFLYRTKVNSKKELSIYLITRGLILVLLELTVVRFSWRFYIDYNSIGGLVIWALGWSMILLSALIYLPRYVILSLSISIIFLHNLLLDGIAIQQNKILDFLLAFFHQPRFVNIYADFGIFILYPVLPMIGLMTLGYVIGEWYKADFDSNKRYKYLVVSGTGTILLFIIIRSFNQYGDPQLWSYQKNTLLTVLSFINVSKYPMSLDYILITIGPSLLFLAFIEKANIFIVTPFKIIGRVSLVYYIVHLYLIHFLALCLAIITHPAEFSKIIDLKLGKLANYGYSLPFVYLIWIGVVTILYIFCIRYDAYRRKSNSKWLRYF
jgi:uncharacterized membrane protein